MYVCCMYMNSFQKRNKVNKLVVLTLRLENTQFFFVLVSIIKMYLYLLTVIHLFILCIFCVYIPSKSAITFNISSLPFTIKVLHLFSNNK